MKQNREERDKCGAKYQSSCTRGRVSTSETLLLRLGKLEEMSVAVEENRVS